MRGNRVADFFFIFQLQYEGYGRRNEVVLKIKGASSTQLKLSSPYGSNFRRKWLILATSPLKRGLKAEDNTVQQRGKRNIKDHDDQQKFINHLKNQGQLPPKPPQRPRCSGLFFRSLAHLGTDSECQISEIPQQEQLQKLIRLSDYLFRSECAFLLKQLLYNIGLPTYLNNPNRTFSIFFHFGKKSSITPTSPPSFFPLSFYYRLFKKGPLHLKTNNFEILLVKPVIDPKYYPWFSLFLMLTLYDLSIDQIFSFSSNFVVRITQIKQPMDIYFSCFLYFSTHSLNSPIFEFQASILFLCVLFSSPQYIFLLIWKPLLIGLSSKQRSNNCFPLKLLSTLFKISTKMWQNIIISNVNQSKSNALLKKIISKHFISLRIPCIIYLHGLSSYVFEGSYLIPHLGKDYSLCLYDLRGHGRNQSQKVTYGIEQSDDLYSIIEHLSSKYRIDEFYLWGRSMGAATCLQFLKRIYADNNTTLQQKIKGVVLDSSFSSFSTIAQQIISSNAYLPAFISSIIVSSGFAKIEEQHKVNFCSLDFTNLANVKCPAVFVFSNIDEVVKPHHSHNIMKNYGGKVSQICQDFTHNEIRSNSLVQKIMKKMQTGVRIKTQPFSSFPLTPKKPIGLSVSISQSNSARKQHKSSTSEKKPIKDKENIPESIRTKLKQNEVIVSSISYAIKQSIKKRKNLKIMTSKKIMEQQNPFPNENPITPTRKIQIPKPKPSTPVYHPSSRGNIPPSPLSFRQSSSNKNVKQYPRFNSSVSIEGLSQIDITLPLTNRRYM